MTFEQHGKLLSLLVKDNGKDRKNKPPFYNFGYVLRVAKNDFLQISENTKALEKNAVEYFLSVNPQNHNLHIYHPCFMDWVTTDKVILYNTGKKIDKQRDQLAVKLKMKGRKRKKKQDEKIKEWNFTPDLPEIRAALQTHYKGTLNEVLLSDTFKLSFRMQNDSTIKDDLFTYIHGNIVDSRDVTYHKVDNKWYRITGEYSDIVDKVFVELMANCYLNSEKDHSGYPKLPLPWRNPKKCKKEKKTPKSPLPWGKSKMFSCTELEDFFDLGKDDVEKLLKTLCEQTYFVKQSDFRCDLVESACSFPETSKIFKEITGIWGKNLHGNSKAEFVHAVESSLYENAVKSSLYKSSSSLGSCVLISKSEALKNVLTSPKTVIRQNKDGEFQVVNANLTKTMSGKIKTQITQKLTDEGLVNFLRSRMSLSEGEYNETYLLQDGFIPGDRVEVHNKVVELFDIMKQDESKKITYLYHVKEGFDNRTRIACSQIRVAAKLLWVDRLKGESTYPDLFYKKTLSAKKEHTVYRKSLRKKMERLTDTEFRKMFSHDTKLVFVYAFMVPEDISSLDDVGPVHSSEFTDIARAYHRKEEEIMEELKKQNFVTEAGFLRDSFIDVSTESFTKKPLFNYMKNKDRRKMYSILAKHRCCISTIPKLELLELDREFSEYQIGGNKIFELKILQIK